LSAGRRAMAREGRSISQAIPESAGGKQTRDKSITPRPSCEKKRKSAQRGVTAIKGGDFRGRYLEAMGSGGKGAASVWGHLVKRRGSQRRERERGELI